MKGEGYCFDPGDATAIRPEIRLTSAVVTGIRQRANCASGLVFGPLLFRTYDTPALTRTPPIERNVQKIEIKGIIVHHRLTR
jgi:hypothetical protein